MTAFATKLTAATFNGALKGLRLPNREKLVAEYVLGGSEAESIKNRADPSRPLTVQGTPTYNTNSVLVRSHATLGYGFLTGIIPADDCTLIVVRKNASQGGSVPKVVMDSTARFGMGQFGSNNYGYNGEGATNQGANRAFPAAGTIYFEALVMSRQNAQRTLGGYGKLYYFSGGSLTSTTSANLNNTARRLLGAFCIGTTSLTDTVTNNNLEVYLVAIYQRPLSEAEIEEAYDAIVAYYAALGVTVV